MTACPDGKFWNNWPRFRLPFCEPTRAPYRLLWKAAGLMLFCDRSVSRSELPLLDPLPVLEPLPVLALPRAEDELLADCDPVDVLAERIPSREPELLAEELPDELLLDWLLLLPAAAEPPPWW